MTPTISDTDAVLRHVDPAGKAVLDAGCGTGANVRWFADRGALVTGAECGASQLAGAREADPDHPDRYVDAPGQDLPFADNSFDLVTFFHSLHHVPRDEMRAALAEAARVVRPDGLVYVAEPLPEGPGHEMFLPIDDETIVRGYAQEALADAESVGLRLRSKDPYTSSWTYVDYAACVDDVVGVDPERQARLADANDELERNFVTYAEITEEGHHQFLQPCTVALLEPCDG